jgi:hypothetical protein
LLSPLLECYVILDFRIWHKKSKQIVNFCNLNCNNHEKCWQSVDVMVKILIFDNSWMLCPCKTRVIVTLNIDLLFARTTVTCRSTNQENFACCLSLIKYVGGRYSNPILCWPMWGTKRMYYNAWTTQFCNSKTKYKAGDTDYYYSEFAIFFAI